MRKENQQSQVLQTTAECVLLYFNYSSHCTISLETQLDKILNVMSPTGCKESQLACTSPQVISTSPKPFLISRIDYNPSVIWISPKKSTCLSRKKKRKTLLNLIAKSSSPRLSDVTFFACCLYDSYECNIVLPKDKQLIK